MDVGVTHFSTSERRRVQLLDAPGAQKHAACAPERVCSPAICILTSPYLYIRTSPYLRTLTSPYPRILLHPSHPDLLTP